MKIYLFKEGIARFSTEKYVVPSEDNFANTYMHLTNYSLNKSSDKWVDEADVENILDPNQCSKRTLTALWKEIGDEEKVE